MHTRFGFIFGLAGTVASLSFCNSAAAEPSNCKYESGIIRPSADMKSGALKGPFLVLMLQADVDPAAPKRAFAVWSKDNTWISVDDFKGPLFLGKDELLMGRPDFMSRGAVYSGCRMQN